MGQEVTDIIIPEGSRVVLVREASRKGKHRRFWCNCSCGGVFENPVYLSNITRGLTKSCGCLRKGPKKKRSEDRCLSCGKVTGICTKSNNRRCKSCAKYKYWADSSKDRHSRGYDFIYRTCEKCGVFHKVQVHNHKNRVSLFYECHSCSGGGPSAPEEEIVDFLKSILGDDLNVVRNDRKVLDGKEIDIFLPDVRV